jgi:hypothetical protein
MGKTKAVKETQEQIVAQLDGGAAQAVGLAGPMNAPDVRLDRRPAIPTKMHFTALTQPPREE